MTALVRAILAVVGGVIASFVAILLVEAVGALAAPAGVAPGLKDEVAMRDYLATLPISAYAFVIAAYLIGTAVGGVVAGGIAGSRGSRAVLVVGASVFAATVANLVMIPHPAWFSAASVAAIILGVAIARQVGPGGRTV